MTDTPRLLIVEDDAALAATLASAFARRGYAIVTAATVDEAAVQTHGFAPTHAIVDLKLRSGSGLDCIKILAALLPPPRIVVLTGFASIATAVEAVKLGATQYLAKPATARDIEAAFTHQPGLAEIDITQRATSLKTQEWEQIQTVLAETGFNITETARRLGLHRRTLARKLAKQHVS